MMSRVMDIMRASKHINTPGDSTPHEEGRLLSMLMSSFYVQDISSSVMADLHNAKGKGGYYVKIIDDFVKVMRKFGVNSVKKLLTKMGSERDKYLRAERVKGLFDLMKKKGIKESDEVINKRGEKGRVGIDNKGIPYIFDTGTYDRHSLDDSYHEWKKAA